MLDYGFDACVWDVEVEAKADQLQVQALRTILKVGARAPAHIIMTITGLHNQSSRWRCRRLSLLLRLLHAPCGSLEQAALLYLKWSGHPWYAAACADLHMLAPSTMIMAGESGYALFAYATGFWGDDGYWQGAQAAGLPKDMLGRPCLDEFQRVCHDAKIRRHIKYIVRGLQSKLRSQEGSRRYAQIATAVAGNLRSKMSLVLKRLQLPGPPLHIALDWAGSPSQKSALCAFFTCYMALAKHAGNFFAKSLCPAGRLQEELCRHVGVEPHCVCLECWHFD